MMRKMKSVKGSFTKNCNNEATVTDGGSQGRFFVGRFYPTTNRGASFRKIDQSMQNFRVNLAKQVPDSFEN